MASSCLEKQTASRESPYNWLVRLGMILARFCDMWILKTQPELMPFGHTNYFVWDPPAIPIGVLVLLTTL